MFPSTSNPAVRSHAAARQALALYATADEESAGSVCGPRLAARLVRAIHNRSTVRCARGDLDGAASGYSEALAFKTSLLATRRRVAGHSSARTLHDDDDGAYDVACESSIARTLHDLALVELRRRDFESARRHLDAELGAHARAAEHARRAGDAAARRMASEARARALIDLARVEREAANLERADAVYGDALSILASLSGVAVRRRDSVGDAAKHSDGDGGAAKHSGGDAAKHSNGDSEDGSAGEGDGGALRLLSADGIARVRVAAAKALCEQAQVRAELGEWDRAEMACQEAIELGAAPFPTDETEVRGRDDGAVEPGAAQAHRGRDGTALPDGAASGGAARVSGGAATATIRGGRDSPAIRALRVASQQAQDELEMMRVRRYVAGFSSYFTGYFCGVGDNTSVSHAPPSTEELADPNKEEAHVSSPVAHDDAPVVVVALSG